MIDPYDDEALDLWFEALLAWDESRTGLPNLPAKTLRYGVTDSQVLDLWLPSPPDTASNLVVSIHGGYFIPDYSREIHRPLVRELVANGFAVANVEYRVAGQGGGVTESTDDVLAALDAIGTALPDLRTAIVGHSAGGYLCERVANHPRVTLAVPLSPLTDLVAQAALSSEDADLLAAWVGCSIAAAPELYRTAHPRSAWPTGSPHVLMHGRHDRTVPIAHSENYTRDARKAGEDIRLVEMPDDGHYAVLDPREPAFAALLTILLEWRQHNSFGTEPDLM